MMQRGQQRYAIFCATCHGLAGDGDGITSQLAFEREEPKWVRPLSLHNPSGARAAGRPIVPDDYRRDPHDAELPRADSRRRPLGHHSLCACVAAEPQRHDEGCAGRTEKTLKSVEAKRCRERRNAKPNDDRTRLAASKIPIATVLAVAGIVVLIVARVLSEPSSKVDDSFTRFSASYLVSYMFFLSISLGALFFVALQHLVRAGWSVTVRRLAEILAANMLWWGVLFFPILVPRLVGDIDPVSLVAPGRRSPPNELLQHKSPYLNGPFFAVRAVFYFSGLGAAGLVLLATVHAARRLGRSETDPAHGEGRAGGDDSLRPDRHLRLVRLADVARPAWSSTIFGLYYFAGSVVGALAALILFALALQKGGMARQTITVEHYHELGKLLLGFIIFWGYMAFSQYMLIWYANIPEESVWYLARQTGPWTWITVGLLFGHLLIPFLGLLPREVKRRKMLLGAWAVWMLVAHWIDIYWLVMPTFAPDRLPFGMMDVCCIVASGVCFWPAWSGRPALANLMPLATPGLANRWPLRIS